MKNIFQRHRITVLTFALVVSILAGVGFHQALADETTTAPPSQVIISKAVVIDQGVEISWIAAQPGTNPIDAYTIQKRDNNGQFNDIDKVGADSLSYIDASGQAGDVYRVSAEDNQDPATSSLPSDSATAVAEEPGSSVAVIPPDATPAPDSVSPTDNQGADVTQDKVAPLQSIVAQDVTALDTAVSKSDIAKSTSAINSLQGYHQQILTSFPQLTTSQKQSFAQSCQQQLSILEPDALLLPESSLPDALTVLAGCEAIQGLAP